MTRRNAFWSFVLAIGLAGVVLGFTADRVVARDMTPPAEMLGPGWAWLFEWGFVYSGNPDTHYGSPPDDSGDDCDESDEELYWDFPEKRPPRCPEDSDSQDAR